MGFHDVSRKPRFRLKEKVLTTRLSLMGVTLAQYLTKRSLREDHRLPDPCVIDLISRAAYEVDDYWRVVKILHKRLSKFSEKKWIGSYKALILLDHLLLNGPLRAAEEFEDDVHIIIKMKSFQYVDHKGFDWGLSVRRMSEHVLKLIEDVSFLKDERDISRKVKIDRIKGAKSFVFWPPTSNKSWKISDEESYNNSRCIYHREANKCRYQEYDIKLDLVDKKKSRLIPSSPEVYYGNRESPSNWICFEEEYLLSPRLNYEVIGNEKGMFSSTRSSPSSWFSLGEEYHA